MTSVRFGLLLAGGRCNDVTFESGFYPWSSVCDEQEGPSTPPEVYIRNIGTAPGGVPIDLRITNETVYRAWNVNLNGGGLREKSKRARGCRG